MESKKITKEDWVWMPHPGHFICSNDCRYKLNTYVNGYIVSTVGELWPDEIIRRIHLDVKIKLWRPKNHNLKNTGFFSGRDRHFPLEDLKALSDLKGDNFDHQYLKMFGYETLGDTGLYETMVFKAKKSEEECSCCPWRIDQNTDWDADSERYSTPENAYKGHISYCEKYDLEPHGSTIPNRKEEFEE